MYPSNFGIMISCYRGDYPLAKGCCASVRAHLPADIPICIIQHGHFAVDELTGLYGVTVLNPDSIDPRLQRSYGYGLTKMLAFWHSPFERFMHIDADAVCWGDVLKGVPWEKYDLIYNEPHEVITPFIQRTQYFDPELMASDFAWQGKPYFNTGCFIARRGTFDLNRYTALLDFQERNPGSIFTDQGILNLMAFEKISSGEITASAWPLQAIVPVIPRHVLQRRFALNGSPIIFEDDRRVLHWAGPKPFLIKDRAFPQPMTFYRLAHLKRARPLLSLLGVSWLVLEEIEARAKTRHANFGAAILSKLRFWLNRLVAGMAATKTPTS